MRPLQRAVYRRQDLECIISPKSIAVIGASPTPKSLGNQTLENLRHFDGPLLPVNGRYEKIGDRPCYASVSPSMPTAA